MSADSSFAAIPRRAFLTRSALATAGLAASSVWLPRRLCADDAVADGGPLIVRQPDPFNAEPALADLVKSNVTPTELFFVRSHGNVPEMDPEAFRLSVEGLVERPVTLSLAELRERFPQSRCTATLTCAGNRRVEFGAFRQVAGVQWNAGAIGNATWAGVKLSDLLTHCGVKEGAAHVWFEGGDSVEKEGKTFPFGGSIPLAKATADGPDMPGALLCHAMNDAPLTPRHGAPLRAVVPGYIGARSVKWLTKIVVSDRPSPNHYLQSAYKIVTADTPAQLAAAGPAYEYPINVAICEPATNAEVTGAATVRGYALPSGSAGTKPAAVEVSGDGGATWTQAKFIDDPASFRWARWEATIAVQYDRSFPQPRRLRPLPMNLVARATDTVGGVTPDRVDWNLHGYFYNGWHHVPVKVLR